MCFLREDFQVTDAIEACSCFKRICEGQGSQRGVASSTTSPDGQALWIGFLLTHQVLCPSDSVLHIDDSPLTDQLILVGSSVSCRSPIIQVEHPKSTRCPVLRLEAEHRVGGASGTTMQHHDQRRSFSIQALKILVCRRVVKPVGNSISCSRELNRFWNREVSLIQLQIGGSLDSFDRFRGEFDFDDFWKPRW